MSAMFAFILMGDVEGAGKVALATSYDKWKTTYPKVIKSLRENHISLRFYSFPRAVWRSIYSTNLINLFNKKIQ